MSKKKNYKKSISAFTVIYNEEDVIERCLKSLYEVVDEIIVIHDGECTDKSLEISKKYTDRIYELQHKGMGELHVIEALEMCKYEWVLRIDADEYLSQDLGANIEKLIEDNDVDAYKFLWKIWDGEKYLTKDFPFKKSFCKKDTCYFIEFPGKELETTGKIVKTNYALEHKPLYNNYSLNKITTKWKKWARIHAEYYIKKDLRFFNCSEALEKDFYKKLDKEVSLAHYVMCPIWFSYSFLKSFLKRGYWKNLKTWKVALSQGIYGWYLCKFISEQKKK